jgi:hypothetical protein
MKCRVRELLGVVLALAAGALGCAAKTVVDLRDCGALGDGHAHPVQEWIADGRYASWRELRRVLPEVTAEWSVDEAAFELAKRRLPAEGGTIRIPAGHYVASVHGWRIGRDHVTLLGAGAERTVLSTGPQVMEALALSGYRHVGWTHGSAFAADDGAEGTDRVTLTEAGATARFSPGQLVFIRNGANRYDQDYGEFNEIAAVGPGNRLVFKLPFARDYTLAAINDAGRLAQAFTLPARDRTVRAEFVVGEGNLRPGAGEVVSIGADVFRVERTAGGTAAILRNLGRANAPPGTRLAAGTKVAKERAILILTRSTRDFRCEGLTVVGRRKALTISNSYRSEFLDCVFERRPGDARVSGGLTIDGDDGRFARFVRCTVRAEPAVGMQFARSFGNAVFEDCTFVDTNVAFTEFNFDCAVSGSRFDVTGTGALRNAIIVGKSCDGLRVVDNRIRARGVAAVFDGLMDIQSYRHGGGRPGVIERNVIEVSPGTRVFGLAAAQRITREANTVTEMAAAPGGPSRGR